MLRLSLCYLIGFVLLFAIANCDGPVSEVYCVYNNTTDYEIDIRGGLTIPPHGQKTTKGRGIGKFTKKELETNAGTIGNGTSGVIRFKDLKTGKVICYNYKKDKDGKPLGFYDMNRHVLEDLSSGKNLKYRITFTFTDADVALADEKTCQEEEERLKKIGNKQ